MNSKNTRKIIKGTTKEGHTIYAAPGTAGARRIVREQLEGGPRVRKATGVSRSATGSRPDAD